jgi:hypothetical protein
MHPVDRAEQVRRMEQLLALDPARVAVLCEETSNRAVRDYLGFAHPSPGSARELLVGWGLTPAGQIG